MTEGNPRIMFYRSSTCKRCAKAEENLRSVLAERGPKYDNVVVEKFTDKDERAVEELRRIGFMSAPTIIIRGRALVEYEPIYDEAIRQLLYDVGM